jgi:hypothetical protein
VAEAPAYAENASDGHPPQRGVKPLPMFILGTLLALIGLAILMIGKSYSEKVSTKIRADLITPFGLVILNAGILILMFFRD